MKQPIVQDKPDKKNQLSIRTGRGTLYGLQSWMKLNGFTDLGIQEGYLAYQAPDGKILKTNSQDLEPIRQEAIQHLISLNIKVKKM